MIQNGKGRTQFTGKRFLLFLGLWLIISFFLYLGIHFFENRNKQELIKTGVAISKDISSQSGLPLLEKKFDLLSRRIEKIKEKPDVIFASIIDHKNKLIAYTDQDQFFTLNREQSGEHDGVIYWKISKADHRKIMNFSSEITFSGTRVGEVFISLAVNGTSPVRTVFSTLVVLSLLAILISFGTVRYKDCLAWCRTRNFTVSYDSSPPKTAPAETEPDGDERFICPMCSCPAEFSQSICSLNTLDNFVVLKNYALENKEVPIEQLGTIEELEWLKRRIVLKSAKIITKLEAE